MMIKKLLLIGLMFQASFAFSQAVNSHSIYLQTFKVRGYVNGIALDSIDAGYAQFGRRNGSETFEYSQKEKAKDMLITDKNGSPLVFPEPNTYIFQLNFFHYNGWDLVPGTGFDLLKKSR